MTVARQVIYIKDIGIVSIPLTDSNNIELYNITIAPKYNSNLISLGHLQETGITYHNNPLVMTLMQQKKVIAYAKITQNFFTLNFVYCEKAMEITIQLIIMATIR